VSNVIVVRRTKDHHKGPKTIAVWEYGQPVPAGLIIGKGAIITVEQTDNLNKEVSNGVQSCYVS